MSGFSRPLWRLSRAWISCSSTRSSGRAFMLPSAAEAAEAEVSCSCSAFSSQPMSGFSSAAGGQLQLRSPRARCAPLASAPPSSPLLLLRAGGALSPSWPSSTAPAAVAALAPLQARPFLTDLTSDTGRVYNERKLMGWSPEQLYDVVSSVEHYSEFVPWCVGSTVLQRRPDGGFLEAELQVGFQALSERYTSQVTLQRPHRVHSSVADSRLFDRLESTWRLSPGPRPGTTWLAFHVDFAFRSALHRHAAALFFDQVVKRMMAAFEARCAALYGPSSLAAGRRAGAGAGGGAGAVVGAQQQQQQQQQVQWQQQQQQQRVMQQAQQQQQAQAQQQAALADERLRVECETQQQEQQQRQRQQTAAAAAGDEAAARPGAPKALEHAPTAAGKEQ